MKKQNYLEKKHTLDLHLAKELQKIIETKKIGAVISYGSLIGTARHKGFIPWDDDIDYIIDIKEKRTLQEAIKSFCYENDKYYFQSTAGTNFSLFEPDYFGVKNAIRYSKEHYDILVPINISSKIDIFSSAYLTNNDIRLMKKYFKQYYYVSSSFRVKNMKGTKLFLAKILRLRYNSLLKKVNQLEEKISKNSSKNDYYSWVIRDGNLEIVKRPVISSIIKMDFEDTKVNAPSNYDELLKIYFGDYMKLPSKENQVVLHDISTFDFNDELVSENIASEEKCNIIVDHYNFEFVTLYFDKKPNFKNMNNIKLYKCWDEKYKAVINTKTPMTIEISNCNDYDNKYFIYNKYINLNVKENILKLSFN